MQRNKGEKMSCIKLYLEDVNCLTASARVLLCVPNRNGGFDIETNRTPLFPEGGGQRSDTGTMNGARILHCREENGTVLHSTDAPFAEGETVTITVDAAVRRLHTQQHTGEHILSFAYAHLFGAENIGFHMSEDVVTIDLDRMISEEEIRRGEAFANEMVWADREIRIFTVDAGEMGELPLRKKNEKLTGAVRIVEIGGGEMCTCCGTHFARTAQVGMIKVLEHIRYKQGCRITFVCGELALRWFEMENRELRRTASKLSVKPEGVYDALQRKEEQINTLHGTLREKSTQLAALYAEKLKEECRREEGFRIAAAVLPVDFDTVKRIAEQLCVDAEMLAVLFCEEGGRLRYFCMAGDTCPKSCRDVAVQLNKALNAKGGGNPKTAQGSLEKTEPERILSALDVL